MPTHDEEAAETGGVIRTIGSEVGPSKVATKCQTLSYLVS